MTRFLLLAPLLLASCTLTPWECDDYQTCELAAGDAPAAAEPAGAVSPHTPAPAAQSDGASE